VLRFRDRKGEHFMVELDAYEVTARTRVSDFMDGDGLARWLEDLAMHPLPWKGAKRWATYEKDFTISATCGSNGSVAFVVTLSGLPGSDEEWHVSAGLRNELGQLPNLAKAARRFFTDVPS
jgi:hypothetical protein